MPTFAWSLGPPGGPPGVPQPFGLGAVAGALGPVGSIANTLQSSVLLGPYNRDRGYAANRRGATALPPLDATLQAYWSGLIGEIGSNSARTVRDSLLSESGIWWPQSRKAAEGVGQWQDYRSDVWQSMVALSQPWPDWQLLRSAWLRGFDGTTQGEAENALKRHGLRDPHWLKLLLEMGEQLGVSEILSLYWGELLPSPTLDSVKILLRGKGYTDPVTIDRLLQLSHALSPAETLLAWNREIFGPRSDPNTVREVERNLRFAGLTNPDAIAAFKQLAKEIPGPSDLVRFGVREVFDPTLAARYTYGAEFPPAMTEWLGRQGYTETFTVTGSDGVADPAMTWPKAYWMSHWQIPSPSQAYTMLQRLRPTGGAAGGPRDEWGTVFTRQDLTQLLKASDYPPFWRDKLESISYRLVDVRPIRWGVKFGIFDGPETTERYQDQGYSRKDAETLTEIEQAKERYDRDAWKRSLDQASRKKIVSCTLNQYKIGAQDNAAANANLVQAGLRNAVANRLLDGIDLCELAAQISEAVRGIRSLFLRGEINAAEARIRLGNSAIVPARIDRYLSLWTIQLTPFRRRLSAAQIIQAVNAGFMTAVQAGFYLTNLGWSGVDQLVLMGLGQQQAAKAFAAAAEKQSAKTKQAAREIAAAIRQSQQTQEHLLAQLRANEPMSTLKSLARKGKISKTEFIDRLIARGIPASSQQYYLKEVYG